MRIKMLLLVSLVLACFFSTGCSGPPRFPVQPPIGFIYTQFKAPLTVDFKNDKKAMLAEGGAETKYLREPCCGTSWGWGSASLRDAMLDYNLDEVEYMDYEYLNVLWLFQKVRVIPHGKIKQ